MGKTSWSKPELIVLVRSKPEEAVLLTCKASGSNLASVPPDHPEYASCISVCANHDDGSS
jgi:hypothetical protein